MPRNYPRWDASCRSSDVPNAKSMKKPFRCQIKAKTLKHLCHCSAFGGFVSAANRFDVGTPGGCSCYVGARPAGGAKQTRMPREYAESPDSLCVQRVLWLRI